MFGDGVVFEAGRLIVVDLGSCIEFLDRGNVSGVDAASPLAGRVFSSTFE